MKFYTKRLLIRPFKSSDATSLYKYASDDRVGPIAGWPVHTSVKESLDIISNVLSNPLTFALCLIDDPNHIIGSIGIRLNNDGNLISFMNKNDAEIGYWIAVPYWGLGLMPEAFDELLKYSFKELNIDTIWCGYYDGNIQSKKVQEKVGLSYVRTEDNVDVPLLNTKRTEHYTSITKDKWINQNK